VKPCVQTPVPPPKKNVGTWHIFKKCGYCKNSKELLRNRVKDLCTKIFILALFKIKKACKNPKCGTMEK
jgi:hypothetical protein